MGASDEDLLAEARDCSVRALVGNVEFLENDTFADHEFGIWSDETGRLHLSKNGEALSYDDLRPRFFKFFDSMLRITVAEHAVGRVFVHAGAVGYNGKAIILPGDSFSGKTTLTGELVKLGADYYSDEYAVLDEHGLLHPFPRDLSYRKWTGDTVAGANVSAQEFGGRVGRDPIPVSLVVITRYEPEATSDLVDLTRGNGMLEVIPHTISRNFNPGFALKVLNTVLADAIILKGPRGEAADFADILLNFFDNASNLATIT